MNSALAGCSCMALWREMKLARTVTLILVESSNHWFSIFDLVRVRDLCCIVLGTTADIYNYDGLRRLPEFRRRVDNDLVRVF